MEGSEGASHWGLKSSVDGHERALLESQIKLPEEPPAKIAAPPMQGDACFGWQLANGPALIHLPSTKGLISQETEGSVRLLPTKNIGDTSMLFCLTAEYTHKP